MFSTTIARTGVVAIAAVAALTLSACEGTSSTAAADGSATVTQTEDVYKIGQAVDAKANGDEARITVANLRQVQPSAIESDTQGRDFWAATVTITATKGTWSANPLYFGFYAADGTKGKDFVSAADVDTLDAGDVPTGATVKGDVVTSVPTGQPIQRITVSGALGSVIATWNVG